MADPIPSAARPSGIRRTAIIIGLVTLAFLAALAAFAVFEFRGLLSRNISLQEQLLDEQEHAHQIDVTINQQAQEWQNLLLRSTDPNAYNYHLARFYERGREINGHIRELQDRLAGNATAQALLQRLQAAHREAALTYRTGLRRMHESTEFPVVTTDELVGDPMNPMLEVAGELNRFMSRRSRTLLEESTGRTLSSLLTILFAAWLAILLALAGGLIRFNRSVTRPLERAIAAAERIASGDLKFSISTAQGGELRGLLAALETMRARLQKNTRDIEASRDGLEILVRERTVELQRSEARYKRAARIGHIGYWEWDIDTA